MPAAGTTNRHVSEPASPAGLVQRGWRELTVATLTALVLLSGITFTAHASAYTRKHRHSPDAAKLPEASTRRVGGVVCGKVRGRWVPGGIVGGDFVSDAQQAHRYAVLGRGTQGPARRTALSRARSYARRAKLGQPVCRLAAATARTGHGPGQPIAGATPSSATGAGADTAGAAGTGSSAAPPQGGARSVYISPGFFGQHLMFNWNLTPAIPVHAMRLWDSNTQWCQMDRGTASNQYDFGQLDALLGQATGLDADVEFTFGYTPQWAASGSYPQATAVNQCSSSTSAAPPADESYWKNYVTAVVSHSVGKIHAYELWNEVNDPNYWSGSVTQMVQMSVDAAAIIHRIDPSAVVLSPSITDSSDGYTFLSQYLASLPPGTIDAIAVHSYTDGAWPEDSIPAELAAVRSALPPAYAHTPIWSTEGGWGLNSQFSSSASDQMAFVARYDLQMLAQGVVRSYWYAYQNTQWGTLWDGTALTPAGIATRTMNAWLVGATFAGCATNDRNLWTCDLTTSAGKAARIVWVRTTPVGNYPTTAYATVSALDGTSSPTGGYPITVTTQPVLLST